MSVPNPAVDRSCAPGRLDGGSAALRAPADGLLDVSLAAIRDNYRRLCRLADGIAVAAVVKADAYGLGAEQVAVALASENCRSFFVAQFGEAAALRAHLQADAELFVLNGLPPGAEEACARLGATPVLNSLPEVERWVAEAWRGGVPLAAALQVDSGMSRLGLSPEEVDALAREPERLGGLRVVLVMSHLACADEPDHPANRLQLDAFRRLAARLPAARRSLANSAGVFLGPDFRFDLVRPGIALYGGHPLPGRGSNPMRPVAELRARIVQLRRVPAGAGIGYGFTRIAAAPLRLATASIGYADGWPRALSNRGAAFHRGHRLPILGRVSMDSVILDAGALSDVDLAPGEFVELIGPHQSLDEVAAQAGTIPYEILTGLGARFERRYRDDG